MRKPIIVREGDNLRLRCSATGYPEPKGNFSFSGIYLIKILNIYLQFSSMEARRWTDN